MRLCFSCCRARLASSCNGKARPWRVCALLSKPNSIVTYRMETNLRADRSQHMTEKIKHQGVEQMITNPRSCCWSPNSSTLILWTWDSFKSVLHTLTVEFALGAKSTYPYDFILQERSRNIQDEYMWWTYDIDYVVHSLGCLKLYLRDFNSL